MQTVSLPLEKLRGAPWNANRMDPRMRNRLKESIRRYGLVENLVVRLLPGDTYEVIGGNWRLKVLSEMDFRTIFHLWKSCLRIIILSEIGIAVEYQRKVNCPNLDWIPSHLCDNRRFF